nr:lantibiotic dehydratase [Micromonospora sp. KC606]
MRTWARADVRDALALASPSLAGQLDRISAGPDTATAKVVRRAVISVAGYLLRWQRRATPFGLFAGVTIAGTGSDRQRTARRSARGQRGGRATAPRGGAGRQRMAYGRSRSAGAAGGQARRWRYEDLDEEGTVMRAHGSDGVTRWAYVDVHSQSVAARSYR